MRADETDPRAGYIPSRAPAAGASPAKKWTSSTLAQLERSTFGKHPPVIGGQGRRKDSISLFNSLAKQEDAEKDFNFDESCLNSRLIGVNGS